jgi:hypothetical protein
VTLLTYRLTVHVCHPSCKLLQLIESIFRTVADTTAAHQR